MRLTPQRISPAMESAMVLENIRLKTPPPRQVILDNSLVYAAWLKTMKHQPREHSVGILGRHLRYGIYNATHIIEVGFPEEPTTSTITQHSIAGYQHELLDSGCDAESYRFVGVFHSHPPQHEHQSQKDEATIRRLKRFGHPILGAVLSPERTVKFFGGVPYELMPNKEFNLRYLEEDFYFLTNDPEAKIFITHKVPCADRLQRLIKLRYRTI